MKNLKILAAFLLTAFIAVSCGNEKEETTPQEEEEFQFTDYSSKTVKTLPETKALVYWGWDARWHELTDKNNRDKWDFVRRNVTGFYTNFIDMWNMVYRNSKTAEQTCKDLYDTFENKNAFFEATMETRVNDSAEGYNNEETDRRTLDLLTGAGFNVDYSSVNYMTVENADYCKERMKLVATYKGNRKCFYLCGPWCFNGNIRNDNDAMEMSTWGDGTQTDGPLGFWAINYNKMQEASYSIVRRMMTLGKESAIMLAPYYAGVDSYDPRKDFLKVSKNCVLGHEDAEAMPEVWTLWMYGAGGMDLFPESEDIAGTESPVCSGTGVAWWLLKHLNGLPTFNYDGGPTETASIDVKKGEVKQIKLTFSNIDCPSVEIAPVIRAVFDTKAKGWHYKFQRRTADLTETIVFNGGLNCKGGLRITSTTPLTIDLYVKADAEAAPLKMEIEAMSNLSNTANKKTVATLTLNPQ